MTKCLHPSRQRTRTTARIVPDVHRVQETCGRCLASRHYQRNDNAGTMSAFGSWSEPMVRGASR